MKNMDKITGTRAMAVTLAAVMMLGGFAMLATPAKAASYHGLWYADLVDGSVMRIVNSADGTDPNGGVTRFWKASEPAFNNINVNTAGGSPYVGMTDWIGPLGQSTTAYASFMQTTGAAGPTDVLVGDSLYSIMELDKTKVAAPRVYYSNSVQIGTVPNGYIWAANHIATADADEEVLPGTAPATTFYRLTQMPAVTFATATTNTWTFPTYAAPYVGQPNTCFASWQLMQSAANNGPWTQVGTAAYGATITYDRLDNNWYSAQVTYTGGVASLVLGQPTQEAVAAGTSPPEASGLSATAYIGSTVTESITFGATITDTEAPADMITDVNCRVDGGTEFNMTVAGGVPHASPATASYVFSLPNAFAVGAHQLSVRAKDNADGWNTTWVNFAFSTTDTTPALSAYMAPTPSAGASLYSGSTATVRVTYADYTPFMAANCRLYYRVNATAWNNVALNNATFAWGSYTNEMQATFPVSGIGGTMSFYATVDDIGAGALVTLGTRTINVLANSGNVQDPYPVSGYAYLYNGNAGAYAPVALANAQVRITWFNTSGAGAWSTITTTTIATGQYSVDIRNYTDGAVVFCNATAPAPYNNIGYNYTLINIANGGSLQNVICGVPYDVVITAPAPLSNVIISTNFAVSYRINDRNGVLCQGYYTFAAGGPMEIRGLIPAYIGPALYTFNGIASATPGLRTDNFQFGAPAGLRWLNVSEGPVGELNPWLTPWGAFNLYSGAAGYLKDWALLQVNVLGGGFNWHLVQGWNIVSVPADPIGKGTNAVFDAFDALALCFAITADPNMKAAARNLATNPSTYVNFDYGMPEAGAFAMGSIYGYWIYKSTAGAQDVNVLALNYSAGSNIVNVAAGWNLLGWTHNMGVTGGTGWGWNAAPTAAMFTTGAVAAGLTVGAGNAKIVATWWNAVPQWYNSYVAATTFPGMAAHNWVYYTNYAYGYWVWSTAAVPGVAFNVAY